MIAAKTVLITNSESLSSGTVDSLNLIVSAMERLIMGLGIMLGLFLLGMLIRMVRIRALANPHTRKQSNDTEAKAAPSESPDHLRASWNDLVERANTLKVKHYEIETDWDVLFAYPALIDVSVPETAEMVEALHRLNGVSHNPPQNLLSMQNTEGTSLSKAVHRAEKAMAAAWDTARYKSTEYLPDTERRQIEKLTTMLKLAQTSDSATERAGAYRSMRRELRRMEKLRFPEPTFEQIESNIRGELET